MHNVEEVTDETEKQQALVFLEGAAPTGELVQSVILPVLDVACFFYLCMVTIDPEKRIKCQE